MCVCIAVYESRSLVTYSFLLRPFLYKLYFINVLINVIFIYYVLKI